MAKWYLNDKFLDRQFTELKNYVFFDFETTGWSSSDPNMPVQTGVYYYQNNKWVCDLFYTRPNCTKEDYLASLDKSSISRQTLDEIAVKVWDIRENYLITEKQTDNYLLREWIIDYEQLVLNFKTIFNNKIVIAYNGLRYDRKILEKLLDDYHVQVEYNMLDPCNFFKYNTTIACAENCDDLKQTTLGAFLNVPNEAKHSAFGDILQLKGIFEKVIDNCKQQSWFSQTMTIKDVIDHLNEQKITISGTKEYELPPISQEQAVIVQHLLNKKNVLVNAVAGSGKTTTALYFAKQLQEQQPKKRILMLMYNRALCDETDIKRKKLQLNNLKVSTIHSYAYNILNSNHLLTLNDHSSLSNSNLMYDEIIKLLLEKLQFCKLPSYDYFIFDEMQDTTIDFLIIFKTLLKANPQAKCLVLGDKFQMIYQYNGATEYPLTAFDKLCHLDMEHCKLSTSFRLPANICNILNTAFLKSDYLHSTKEPEKKDNFKLYIANEKTQSGQVDAVVDYILEKKTKESAKDDDFFILLPNNIDKSESRLSWSNLETLINHLVDKKINICHNYDNDKSHDTTSKKNKNEWKNKLVVTTYHKVKGCERKYVILWHFDVLSEYGHLDPITAKNISNPHYVALTRAKEELFLVCHEIKITRERYFIIINRSPVLLDCNSLWPYVKWDLLKPYLIKNTILTLNVKFFTLDGILNKEFYDINPSSIKTKLSKEILFKIAIKIKQHGAMHTEPKAKLNVQNSLTTTNDLYYHNNISIINALWLLLRYWQITDKKLFQSMLQNIAKLFRTQYRSKDTLDDVTKQLFSEYAEPYITNRKERIVNYAKWTISRQVKCLAVFYALTSNTYEWMQINDFNWLNNFQQDQALKVIFNQFTYPEAKLEVLCHLRKDNKTFVSYDYDTAHGDNSKQNDKITQFFENDRFNINGCIDLVTKTALFEFKYESNFQNEDYLQSALYLFMTNWIKRLIWLKDKRHRLATYNKIILLNYTNGTYFELPYDQDFLNEIMLDILNGMKENFFHSLSYDEFCTKFERELKHYNLQ